MKFSLKYVWDFVCVYHMVGTYVIQYHT